MSFRVSGENRIDSTPDAVTHCEHITDEETSMGFIKTVALFGAGYVLGARAGRGRYEQIKNAAQSLWNSDTVVKGRDKAKDTAMGAFGQAQDVASEKIHEASATVKTKVSDAADAATSRTKSDPDEIRVEAVRFQG